MANDSNGGAITKEMTKEERAAKAEETARQLAKPVGNVGTVRDLLSKSGDAISKVLPKHLSPERLTRVMMLAVNQNNDLLKCTGASLMQAVIQSASLGLEPGGSLGHAYLVPYGTGCTFIIGYRGMLDLARRSGQIESIEAHVVYSADKFIVKFGTEPKIDHEPEFDRDRGAFRLVYAVAKLKDGGIVTEVMTKADVDAIKARSKARNGPWQTDYNEMARKTVVRRIFKYLPVSIEVLEAVDQSDRAEFDTTFSLDAIGAAASAEKPKETIDADTSSEIKLAAIKRLLAKKMANPKAFEAAMTATNLVPDLALETLNVDQLTLIEEAFAKKETK